MNEDFHGGSTPELTTFNLSVLPETVEVIDRLQSHLGLPDQGAVFMKALQTLEVLVLTDAQVIMKTDKAKDMGLTI